MWTLKYTSLLSLAGWCHKERDAIELSVQADQNQLPLGHAPTWSWLFPPLNSHYIPTRDADIGYWVGPCAGKDSKAKYGLKDKECYEWSLIPAKGSGRKVVGHIWGGGVFAISGQYSHLILAYTAPDCTYQFIYTEYKHCEPNIKAEFHKMDCTFPLEQCFAKCIPPKGSTSNLPEWQTKNVSQKKKWSWNNRTVLCPRI